MIIWIAKFFLARNPAMTLGHAKRLATGAIVIAAIVAAVIGFVVWDYFDDQAVENRVTLERDNKDLRANAQANETAGIAKAKRDRIETQEQKGLEDEVDQADADGRSAADDVWSGGLFDPES